MRKLIIGLLAVVSLVVGVAAPASAFPPVYQYLATNPATTHNAGAPAVLDLEINGVTYNDRDVQIQAAPTGGTLWGGPNVPKAQTKWKACWYLINPQTQPATIRLDVLLDGTPLTYGDVTLTPFAHVAGTPFHVSPVCGSWLFPFAPSQTQIRAKVLVNQPGNFTGVYKTTLEQLPYP